MDLADELKSLVKHAEVKIADAKSLSEIGDLRTHFLGRKGDLTDLLKSLSLAAANERPKLGALANQIKLKIEGLLANAEDKIGGDEIKAKLMLEAEDVTEPGRRPVQGHIHIINQAIEEIAEIFERAGFSRLRQNEVEWDRYAFEALNMPKDHPARDEWETFFMEALINPKMGRMLLTPHATSGTARTLEAAAGQLKKGERANGIRAINISKTYRRQIDATHLPMFHQFDGLYLDENVSITHLIGILDYFVKEFFGAERKTRLRPFHFRFTEPSFEIDVSCGVCDATGLFKHEKCKACKRGWVELGGAGMLHPNVLQAAGIDPKKYSALAFGWGIERTYMMKEGLKLDDIRLLYKNDLRFLRQF